MDAALCEGCGLPLGQGRRPQTRYHDPACKQRAYRMRRATKGLRIALADLNVALLSERARRGLLAGDAIANGATEEEAAAAFEISVDELLAQLAALRREWLTMT